MDSPNDSGGRRSIGLAATLIESIEEGKAGSQAGKTAQEAEPAPSGKSFPVKDWERYEFIRLLGRGGMGAVYQARDLKLGRVVALKFISGSDSEHVQRFQQEARAQARIDHPYVCKVFEV